MQSNMFELTGFGGMLILLLDLWALISIMGSGASTGRKVVWVLLVFLLPVIGFLIWLVAGPRAETNRA